MHLHNEELRKKEQKKESSVHKVDAESISGGYVDKFGFQVTTCCGFIPQDNSWADDWPVGLCSIKTSSHCANAKSLIKVSQRIIMCYSCCNCRQLCFQTCFTKRLKLQLDLIEKDVRIFLCVRS